MFQTHRSLLIKTLAGAAIALTTGCSPLDKLRENITQYDDFHSALAAEYLAFSDSEAVQYDWQDSDYFAKKGIKAVKRKLVFPEHPSKWHIRKEERQALEDARERLLAALIPLAKKQYPYETARAQLLYDCWIEQQEEEWQEDDIFACKSSFYLVLTDLEIRLKGHKAKDEADIETKIQADPIPSYRIYFNEDSDDLPGEAWHTIRVIKEWLEKADDSYRIRIEGHSDRKGYRWYNFQLSKKRAKLVQDAFVKEGIDIPISTEFYGETNPTIETGDAVKEPLNRRVDIFLEPIKEKQ